MPMNHQRESIVNEPEAKSINEDYEIKLGGTQFTIYIWIKVWKIYPYWKEGYQHRRKT